MAGIKLSARNRPILQIIKSGNLKGVATTKQDLEILTPDKNLFAYLWLKHSYKMLNDVKVLTIPFHEAVLLAKKKIVKPELFADIGYTAGVIMVDKMSVCYSVQDYGSVFAWFNNNLIVGYAIEEREPKKLASYISSEIKNSLFKDNASKSDMIGELFRELYATLGFIKYAEVETVHLPSLRKTNFIGCKYVNDTGSDIRIYNSKWFTTLIKSDEFKVHGHFRLQPYKKGKKLIWISDYKKSGYTSKAQKLKYNKDII